jgi:hypothetical protein
MNDLVTVPLSSDSSAEALPPASDSSAEVLPPASVSVRKVSAVALLILEAKGKAIAKQGNAMKRSAWEMLAEAAESMGCKAVVDILEEDKKAIAEAIEKAVADRLPSVTLNGYAFPLKRSDKTGDYTATSKQAVYVRVSDWASLIKRIGALKDSQQEQCLRDTEKDHEPIRKENDAKAKAAYFEQVNAEAAASPFHRFNLKRKALAEAVEKAGKAEEEAKKKAAAAATVTAKMYADLKELDAEIKAFEAAAGQAVDASGKYDAEAIVTAKRKAEEAETARKDAEAAKQAAEEEAANEREARQRAEQAAADLRARLAAPEAAEATGTEAAKPSRKRIPGNK